MKEEITNKHRYWRIEDRRFIDNLKSELYATLLIDANIDSDKTFNAVELLMPILDKTLKQVVRWTIIDHAVKELK